jgi:predicted ATP-dependent endonuclease of OLD family
MIYKKLGIDPFRDVMNHDPKVIEEQVSQMDFTELIKEFYDEEKKQLPEFTATIFKELERRERIGLHLKI